MWKSWSYIKVSAMKVHFGSARRTRSQMVAPYKQMHDETGLRELHMDRGRKERGGASYLAVAHSIAPQPVLDITRYLARFISFKHLRGNVELLGFIFDHFKHSCRRSPDLDAGLLSSGKISATILWREHDISWRQQTGLNLCCNLYLLGFFL